MNKKLGMLAIAALVTLSGAILKGTQMANANLVQTTTVTHQNFTDNNLTILAQGYGGQQGSPWGQVAVPQIYTNPDTGQAFCFYTSGLWAPCPNHGTSVIRSRNAKCRGSNTTQALVDQCPRALCGMAALQSQLSALNSNGGSTPPLPCNGLP
ncbi:MULTISPECIES: hypothetical protein [unclassified Microcoleus]|uniref:hypothetical protein n=1 Tax=unclassified Microcoleus TaxID=2642155 RepID=UPI002FD72944